MINKIYYKLIKPFWFASVEEEIHVNHNTNKTQLQYDNYKNKT